jgi:hypothetical protein
VQQLLLQLPSALDGVDWPAASHVQVGAGAVKGGSGTALLERTAALPLQKKRCLVKSCTHARSVTTAGAGDAMAACLATSAERGPWEHCLCGT